MGRRPGSFAYSLVCLVACAAGVAAAADAPAAPTTAVAAADAADHVGEECVVEMVVRAARALAYKDICFLNSNEDRRDEDNFTVVIFKAGLEEFREAGIENPALHFLDKTIRVKGVVGEHKDRPQIVVTDPAQIEVVEAVAASATAEDR